MDDPIFLNDGYTREGVIAAVRGLHGPLTFTYRPSLCDERHEFARVMGEGGKAYSAWLDKLIARRVVSWDPKCRNAAGEEEMMPVTADNAAKLHPALKVKLVEQILGYAPADELADAKN